MIDRMDISIKASQIRKEMGEDMSSPIDIFSLAHTIKGLTIVLYPFSDNISGACLTTKKSSIIAINSAMSLGRQRFSLAHELYHHFFDEDMCSTLVPSIVGIKDENEQKADLFASYFLMPPTSLRDRLDSILPRKLSIADVVKLEQYYQVSRRAMLKRLLEEGALSEIEASQMTSNVRLSAAKLGYDIQLYTPLEAAKQYATFGYYISKTEELYQNDRISSGKYEELLLDAFRSDMVFGEDSEEDELVD